MLALVLVPKLKLYGWMTNRRKIEDYYYVKLNFIDCIECINWNSGSEPSLSEQTFYTLSKLLNASEKRNMDTKITFNQ